MFRFYIYNFRSSKEQLEKHFRICFRKKRRTPSTRYLQRTPSYHHHQSFSSSMYPNNSHARAAHRLSLDTPHTPLAMTSSNISHNASLMAVATPPAHQRCSISERPMRPHSLSLS